MKITVLVMMYNHEKFISKAMEGILMQKDCPEFEIIVCDDSSSDKGLSIVTEMVAGLENVTIHTNPENLGITRNYQQAFSQCRGEYIFVLEGDDYWTDPFKLKKQCALLDQRPDLAMCAHTFVSLKADTGVFIPPANHKNEPVTVFESEDLIMDQGIISNFSTCCYRRNVLKMISEKTYTTTSYEWMINISVGQFGSLARINEPMSVYRVSSAGAWSAKTLEQQLVGLIGIVDVYDEILEHKYHQHFTDKKIALKHELAHLHQMPPAIHTKTFSLLKLPSMILNKLFTKLDLNSKAKSAN